MTWDALASWLGILLGGGLLALWFDRRLKAAQTLQARAEAQETEHGDETTGWEQARIWRDRWQEEVAAREADRGAHRLALETIARERAEDGRAFHRLIGQEATARRALEDRVATLEGILRQHGIPLPSTS